MSKFKLGHPHPISPEQVEYRLWLASMEKRAILPIKWIILAGSLVIWLLNTNLNALLPWYVFGLFFTYMMWNLGFSYIFLMGKPTPPQIRPLCLASFLIDLVFVTLLIYMDSVRIYVSLPQDADLSRSSDFFVLYFVMIFRGFALFQSRRDGFILSLAIICLFGFSAWLTKRNFEFLSTTSFTLQIFMVWLMILIAWFIVDVIRGQQTDLRRAQENLVRTESLAMVGEMASGVAHEVNNPIGIISAYAENLLHESKEDDPRRQDLQIMAQESQRCKSIISELLSFARPSRQQSELVDLRELNDEVCRFVFHDQNAGIDLRKEYRTVALVDVNPMQMKQALVNIYLNARQAIGDAGVIDVHIEPNPGRAGYVRIRISDDGPGIRKEDEPHVFEPFFTRKEQGTGLGLSITKRIVDIHGGLINVGAKSSGHGALVEISLPAAS
ncbi:hypothetical protein JXA32_13195 [Candidatus Sumerlaeota bacterium]|nr:hypothetical protein [Candidatus Sumerlaeota bacterium]